MPFCEGWFHRMVTLNRGGNIWTNQNRRLRQRLTLRARRFISNRKLFHLLLTGLAVVATLPPLFFHFKLRRFSQMQSRKCGWLSNPPLVCAHGGDSSTAFPNTMTAYRSALVSQVDCIEIDVSRSSDGVLFALHDRDLQRISGNSSCKVGHLTMQEIKGLGMINQLRSEFLDLNVPTMEEALKLVSGSIRQIILDAKVGPPLYEKGLAENILFIVEKAQCKNCIVWAKDDILVRDIIKLSSDTTAGYIVMIDPSTGARNNALRIKEAGAVGVYHLLIDEKLMKILHGTSKKVFAWTVDDMESMQKMLYEHVDGIVTSQPISLQRLMHDIRTQCLEQGFSLSS